METVEYVETVETVETEKVSLTYSVSDNLKARDASASKTMERSRRRLGSYHPGGIQRAGWDILQQVLSKRCVATSLK